MFTKRKRNVSEGARIKCRKGLFIVPAVMVGGISGLISVGQEAQAAETKFSLCNKNNESIYVSIAYEPEAGQPLMSRGWWMIEQNKCIDLSLPVAGDRLLVHGQSASKIKHWAGTQELCVHSVDKFDYATAQTMSCDAENQTKRSFKEVSITSLTSAAAGGTPTINFNPADAVKVGNALKICNDHNENTYISFAQKRRDDAKYNVNGWFQIKPGTCYETLRDSEANELLLFGQSENSNLRWRGTEPLCTDDYSGFEFDDAQSMDCTGMNQRLQLFRKIQLTSAGDIEYRLRSEDAHAVRSLVELCNVATEKVFVAVAYQSLDFPDQVVSIGWYNIEPGKCSSELAIDANHLAVRVETEDHDELLGGNFEACVHSTEGYEFGNATKMVCTGDLEMTKFDLKAIATGKVRLELP